MHLVPPGWRGSDSRAIYENGEWLSYAALCARVEAVADCLPPVRSLAFCFCTMSTGTVVNYLACLLKGHPVALLDANLDSAAKLALVDRYQPELLLASEDSAEFESSESEGSYDALPTGLPGCCIWRIRHLTGADLHPELALLLTTSGSTGTPKLVRLSGRNITANADAIRHALHIGPAQCAMCSLPFHYSYGLSVLNSHLRAGASLAITPNGILSAGFWDVCRQAGCTSFAGVPYTYQLLKRLQLDKLQVPRLITFTQAGGKLSPALISEFRELAESRHGQFFVMYGQTEATARIAILSPSQLADKLDSVGLPIGGGSFQISDENGDPIIEPDTPGEIVYSGPNVMLGYAMAREDLARGDEMGGRLRTGDLGHMDEDGYLYVSGRLRREAKVSGHRINLDEIEDLLKQHGPTAVLAGPEKIRIFCEWGDAELHSQALRQLANKLRFSLGAFELKRVGALPMTGNGKIDYQTLAAFE